ncbi:uncharacterized protein LOC142625052 [Castanea sativa]|uniref:uncharacterized protein LOC142625052 n=1 Tax=Castanea sativa TaxID=21020 RepID=UPI003F64E653
MAMREGGTLKTYFDKYWKIFNEIDGDLDDVAIRTFKVGLPTEHDLRKPLTKKPVRSEPMHQVLEKIQNEPYFKWPNKLVKEGRLKQFLYWPNGQGDHSGSVNQGNNASRPPLGMINVIFIAPGRTDSHSSRVMLMARTLAEESSSEPKRIKGNVPPILGFSEEDKIGTIQPHDDALVVTLRIGGYDVKRGLNLKLEDLTAYDSPLISFEGKAVIPKGQIRLLVQSGPKVVDVDFIVIDAYSSYTAIVARPWLHALGAVSSTLHVKVKFPSRDQIKELIGSQFVARQCMAVAILH